MKEEIDTVSLPLDGAVARDCVSPEIGQLLSRYIVNSLADTAAGLFEEHMIMCRPCRDDYLRLNWIIKAVRANPEEFFGKSKKPDVKPQ